jgi:NAD(P)-dependent dehydrogenase (short-subunit alcohol dehydrogenase family)
MARKVAFISGASRGIGKAAAITLAEAGYDVVVTARTVHEGEKHEDSQTVARSAGPRRANGRDAVSGRTSAAPLPRLPPVKRRGRGDGPSDGQRRRQGRAG